MRGFQALLLLFTLNFVASQYYISMTCENQFSLYVDEKFIGFGENYNSTQQLTYNNSQYQKIIAINARNKEGLGGCIGDFGGNPSIASEWKAEKFSGELPKGWEKYDFDDTSWPYAT